MAVKGPSLPAAAAHVGPLLGPETVVLPAMNGVPWWFFHGLGGSHEGAAVRAVDPDGRVAAAIPVRHVIGCVVHATCSVVGAGARAPRLRARAHHRRAGAAGPRPG